jgi:hypothetical protein
MIMPSKYIQEKDALIGVSALITQYVNNNLSLSGLWETLKQESIITNFERFILALDLLFILGVVKIEDNIIKRATND